MRINFERQIEREEEELERQFADGEITNAEFNKLVHQLHRDAAEELRSIAEEEAQRAYDDIMGRW